MSRLSNVFFAALNNELIKCADLDNFSEILHRVTKRISIEVCILKSLGHNVVYRILDNEETRDITLEIIEPASIENISLTIKVEPSGKDFTGDNYESEMGC